LQHKPPLRSQRANLKIRARSQRKLGGV